MFLLVSNPFEIVEDTVHRVAEQVAQAARNVQQVVAQSDQLRDSAQKMLASAQGGGFGFQPEAADAMIRALQECLDAVHGMGYDIGRASQAPKLGQTPGAQAIAPFTQNAATDERGLRLSVKNLEKVLTDMIAAYQEAKKHYDENDTIAAQRLRQLHR